MKDILRCEPYLVGETDAAVNADCQDVFKDFTSPMSAKVTYVDWIRNKKQDLVVKYPNMPKKDIHAMALEMYKNEKSNPSKKKPCVKKS